MLQVRQTPIINVEYIIIIFVLSNNLANFLKSHKVANFNYAIQADSPVTEKLPVEENHRVLKVWRKFYN